MVVPRGVKVMPRKIMVLHRSYAWETKGCTRESTQETYIHIYLLISVQWPLIIVGNCGVVDCGVLTLKEQTGG